MSVSCLSHINLKKSVNPTFNWIINVLFLDWLKWSGQKYKKQ